MRVAWSVMRSTVGARGFDGARNLRSVVDRATAVARARLVLGPLPAVPERVVDVALAHAGALGDRRAGVHRARADLALLRAGAQVAARVDVRGQALLVQEHALAAQHVRDEVVGEDRQRVEVAELGDAGEREVAGGDLRALVEALV